MVTRRGFVASSAAMLALPLRAAFAQSGPYPNRAIKMVVPLPPGGSPDYLSRLLGERLQAVLGQPVIVDNKPGVGGNIAREYVAKQPADGYTLILADTTHVMNVSFFKQLPYDPIRDFEPVAIAATIPFMLAVNPALPVNSMNDLINLARAKPGTLTYGTSGIGSPHHFAVELLRSMTGIDVVQVPYKGSAGILPAVMAGDVSFTIAAVNSMLPHFRTGKLRPIAVASANRIAVLPDIPTIAEAVPLPGYSMEIWLSVLAPAGTPRPIVERLNVEINRVMADPQFVKEKLLPVGLEPVPGAAPERLGEVMKRDLDKFTRIAKDAGMKAE